MSRSFRKFSAMQDLTRMHRRIESRKGKLRARRRIEEDIVDDRCYHKFSMTLYYNVSRRK